MKTTLEKEDAAVAVVGTDRDDEDRGRISSAQRQRSLSPSPTTPSPPPQQNQNNDDGNNGNNNENNSNDHDTVGVCCFHLKFGTCHPPHPPCRWRHVDPSDDDGTVICCFGATCRLGHAHRVLDQFNAAAATKAGDKDEMDPNHRSAPTTTTTPRRRRRRQYWQQFNQSHAIVGNHPCERDATRLQSQLEPWRTAELRRRLCHVFGVSRHDPRALEFWDRGRIMPALLQRYHERVGRERTTIYRRGTPIVGNAALRAALWKELQRFRTVHTVNARPAVKAQAYLVLHPPSPQHHRSRDNTANNDNNNDNNANNDNATTTTTTLTRKGRRKAKKWKQFEQLWNLSLQLLTDTLDDDATNIQRFCRDRLTAVAVTYNFVGSPHIDKQDTGPFYAVSLSNLPNETENDHGGSSSSSSSYTSGVPPRDERGSDAINKNQATTTGTTSRDASSTSSVPAPPTDHPHGGKLCVEVDPLTVAVLDTQNRIVQVDGRYPHWVVPYDTDRYDRFSLIYYSTKENEPTATTTTTPPSRAFWIPRRAKHDEEPQQQQPQQQQQEKGEVDATN